MPDPTETILLQEEKETTKEIGRLLWWVQHRGFLRRLGLWAFVVVDAGLVLFALWGIADAFLVSWNAEKQETIHAALVNQDELHAYTIARAAAPISVSDARVFSSGEERYDFFSELENTNEDWWAEFQYQFTYEGGSTLEKTGFILPSSKKPLAELAFFSKTPVQNIQLQFSSVNWHRIDHHLIPNYPTWSADRLAIETENGTVTQQAAEGTNGLFNTTFVVHNKTAFSYDRPRLYLLLKRGSTVVGVNTVSLRALNAGETQTVSVNWFGTSASGTQVDIVPDLNIFDKNIYKTPEGTPSVDTRETLPF